MYNYQVIITKNNENFRFIAKYIKKENAVSRYDNLIKENEKVKFEKKIINFEPVKYRLELLTRKKEYGIIKHSKDDFGRNIIFEPKNGWYKLKRQVYLLPESFKIYGYPQRYTFNELTDFFGTFDGDMMISMSRIFNTLIFRPDDMFPLIVTLKTEKECKRLYNTVISERIPNIIPFGHMDITNRKRFYKEMKILNVPLENFYRKSTR